MMEIREIRGTDHIHEMWDLLLLHGDELNKHKHLMSQVHPDVSRYANMEDLGMIITLALYHEEKIVGYSVCAIIDNMHFANLKVGINELLFLHPEYRKGSWGVRLIKAMERAAADRGAKMILFSGRNDTTFSELMPKIGYEIEDVVFSKELI